MPVQFLVGSKRSIGRLSIKLNDLDLSTHVALSTFFRTAVLQKKIKVLFSLRILPLMLGRGGGGGVLHQRRGVIDWKRFHIVIYKKV